MPSLCCNTAQKSVHWGSRKIAPRKIAPPSPNSNANPKPKPNPDPDRGAIFLGAIFWTLLIKDYKSLMFKRLIYKRFPLRILQ